jgi:uncharacterized protein (DUF1501 family)
MAGAGGFLGVDQWLRGAAAPDYTSPDYNPGNVIEESRQKSTLVTIFLRGGADSLNAFVPIADPKYYEYRPKIAIKPNFAKGAERGAIPIDHTGKDRAGKESLYGLNAAMEPLIPLYKEGMVVPILNVGSPDGTRSHFSAQDNMERGCTSDTKAMQGWLNRYLERSRKPFDAPLRGLSAMSLVPRALRGRYPVLAGNNKTEQMDKFEQLYAPSNLVYMTPRDGMADEVGSRFEDRPSREMYSEAQDRLLTSDMTRDIITESGTAAVERIKALDKAMATSSSGGYPGGGLGHQLSTIAKVIKADVGLEVAQADYDGWDHHRGQGGETGTHTQMVGHLTQCITAFVKDMGPRMDRVMLLVMSEFGRTVHENGANGTDHGHGGFMLAVGGMLNGGQFYGADKSLDQLHEGRYQPTVIDFRTVFAESLIRLFRFDPYQKRLFPGYKGTPKELLGFAKQMKEV